MNTDDFLICLNGRFMHEGIYDQDYPLVRPYKVNFDGEEITQRKYDDVSVTYYSKYNNNGFRCEDFIKDHNGKHILFAGCSETVGEGSVIEDAWPNMLYNKIAAEEVCSGFFSLGIGGGSWFDICSLIMKYIDAYGSPDYLFINFPGIGRLAQYIDKDNPYGLEKSGVYRYSLHYKTDVYKNNSIKNIGTTNFDLSEQAYIAFSLYIRLFEKFCEQNNIKLFWGTWCDNLMQKINRGLVEYKNFIGIHPNKLQLADLCLSNKELNLEKQDGHFGTAYHKNWSNVFYNHYKGAVNE